MLWFNHNINFDSNHRVIEYDQLRDLFYVGEESLALLLYQPCPESRLGITYENLNDMVEADAADRGWQCSKCI